MLRFWTFSLGLTFFISTQAFAQLANGFHIDGTLTNLNTGAAQTSGNVTFTIIGGSNTGCAIFEETQALNVATGGNVDAAGNFSMVVGAGGRTSADSGNSFSTIFQDQTSIPGKPSCLVSASEGRLLKITVGSDILGTVALGAVPVAFVAQTLQGHPASDFIVANGGMVQTFNMAINNGIKFTAPGGSSYLLAHPATSGALTLTLPPNAGTNGQLLATDGAGTLSWVAPAAGGGGGGGSSTAPAAYTFNSNSGGGNAGGFSFQSQGVPLVTIASNGQLNASADIRADNGTGYFANLNVPGNGTIDHLNVGIDSVIASTTITGQATLGNTIVAGNHPFTMQDGNGAFSQTFTGTGPAHTVLAKDGTTGNVAKITSSSTTHAAGDSVVFVDMAAPTSAAITRYGLTAQVSGANTSTSATGINVGVNVSSSAPNAGGSNYGINVIAQSANNSKAGTFVASGTGNSNYGASFSANGAATTNIGLSVAAQNGTSANTGIYINALGTNATAIQANGGNVTVNSGNVGIGVTNPTYALQVVSGATSSPAVVISGSSSTAPAVALTGPMNGPSLAIGQHGSGIVEVANILIPVTCAGAVTTGSPFTCSSTGTAKLAVDGTTVYTPPATMIFLSSCVDPASGKFFGTGAYTSSNYSLSGIVAASGGSLPTLMNCMATSFKN